MSTETEQPILAQITGETSDGYHTFNELYEHRHALFLALMASHPEKSWFSKFHADGTIMAGWFIAGMQLPTGGITYHLPDRLWPVALRTGAFARCAAPEWDGHTADDVVTRLNQWILEQELDRQLKSQKTPSWTV